MWLLGRANADLALPMLAIMRLVDKMAGALDLARLVLRCALPLISVEAGRLLRSLSCLLHLLLLLLLVAKEPEERVTMLIGYIRLEVAFALHAR